MYDIIFLVGEKPIQKHFPAHRSIVSASSPVLHRLCHEKPTKDKIVLPNDDPDDFILLLRHIYGKEITIESMQHAWNLLPLAKKYCLLKLEKICKRSIVEFLDGNNACSVYEEAKYQEEGDLILQSFKFIMNNTKLVFQEKGLIGAHPNTVSAIIRQECINVDSEYQIFSAILEWARIECALIKYSDRPKSIREVIKPLLPYIRFLQMRVFEFLKQDNLSCILSKREIIDILMNLVFPGSSTLPSWCNACTIKRHLKSELLEKSWNNPCWCISSKEKCCMDAVTTFRSKGLFLTAVGLRLSLNHSSFVKSFSAIITLRVQKQIHTILFEKRKIITIGKQIARFENPIYIKNGETFQLLVKVGISSPPLHCCELKPYTDSIPFVIISGIEEENEGKNLLNINSCFCSVCYLFIT